jgi:hypothetical protein
MRLQLLWKSVAIQAAIVEPAARGLAGCGDERGTV